MKNMIIQDEKPNHFYLFKECECGSCDCHLMIGTPELFNNRYMITIDRKENTDGLSVWFSKEEMIDLIQELQELLSLNK